MSDLTLIVGNDNAGAILINTPDGISRAEIWLRGDKDAEDGLARRIVACVNALKGVDTPWIESVAGTMGLQLVGMRNDITRVVHERDDAYSTVARMTRERDEARAMVKELELVMTEACEQFLSANGSIPDLSWRAAVVKARAFLGT